MKNRLIDAEALKEVIKANHYLLSAKNNSTDYGMFTTGIMQAIDNAPTVCGNNPKWCESCVSKGKCASTSKERTQGDFISRSALKEDFECVGFNDYDDYNRALRIIDNAPTVEYPFYAEAYQTGYEEGKNDRPQGEWIPVSERLPEEYDSYLVMWRSLTEGFPDRLFYEICEYEPEEDEWERIEQSGEAGAEIVAWMPLPQPYTKEETT